MTDASTFGGAARRTDPLDDSPDSKRGPAPAEGDVLDGKYRVVRTLGAGGMGIVLLCEHLRLGKLVALKLVRSAATRRAEGTARLLREARSAARIQGDHVARVMDVGTLESGAPYIIFEYLEGTDLARRLKERGPMPAHEAASVVVQACSALEEAHRLGIVHRDLKPSNLFLSEREDGTSLVKVLDFGIAKDLELVAQAEDDAITDSITVVGSPAYMSPEQIRNARAVDARTDIWSLGVILHELLTGRLPFGGESRAARLAAVVADAPLRVRVERPDLPAALETLILDCLDKNVERRVPNARALHDRLLPFTNPAPAARRPIWLLSLAAAIALIAIALFSLRADPPAAAERQPVRGANLAPKQAISADPPPRPAIEATPAAIAQTTSARKPSKPLRVPLAVPALTAVASVAPSASEPPPAPSAAPNLQAAVSHRK